MGVFIEHQSHRSSENNPEHSWRYWEASSATNDYRGQQQISHYQPAYCNERQQCRHDMTARNDSYYNLN